VITAPIEHLYLASWAVVLFLLFLSEAIALFAAYFRLDQMEAHFIASFFVSVNRSVLGNGPLGRMKRVRQIGALTSRFSPIHMFNPQAVMEAETFPEHLKKWACTPGRLFRFALTGAGLLMLWLGIEWLCRTLSKPVSDMKLLCISVLIACLMLALIAVLAKIWTSYFKLAEMEAALKNSYFVARNRRVMGHNVYGRYCRLSHISAMLLLDNDFLTTVDPAVVDELACFPLSLRRLVLIPARMLAYSFLGYCVVYLSGKFFGVFA
jgi:hypothetical protein